MILVPFSFLLEALVYKAPVKDIRKKNLSWRILSSTWYVKKQVVLVV